MTGISRSCDPDQFNLCVTNIFGQIFESQKQCNFYIHRNKYLTECTRAGLETITFDQTSSFHLKMGATISNVLGTMKFICETLVSGNFDRSLGIYNNFKNNQQISNEMVFDGNILHAITLFSEQNSFIFGHTTKSSNTKS